MTVLCLCALVTGVLAALALPFLPFALAVIVALVTGSVLTAFQGVPLLHLFFIVVLLLGLTQVGYAVGLVGCMLLEVPSGLDRRAKGAQQTALSGQELRKRESLSGPAG